MRKQSLLSGLALIVPAVLGGCKTNQATGDRMLALMDRDKQIALGQQAAPEFKAQFGGELPDPELRAYVTELGQRLAATTEGDNQSLPWEFTLLNTDVINAFALPGGKVFFTRGLAARLTNEAQMAGVLGHEIGHVTAEHAARRFGQQALFNAGILGAAIAVGVADENSNLRKYGQYGVPALAVGGNVMLLKFSRDEESQADTLGVRYMTRAGYNPVAQIQVMQILKEASGPSGTPEWLATHPLPQTRIDRLQKIVDTQYAEMKNDPRYGFNEEQYRSRFLSRLAKLPPAPPPPKQTALLMTGDRIGAAYIRPSTWSAKAIAAAKAREAAASATTVTAVESER